MRAGPWWISAAVFLLVLPLAAQTPHPFDGTYQGVSHEVERYKEASGKGSRPCTVQNPVPLNLRIANGGARAGDWEGTVTPQGALTMRRPNAELLQGQIDNQGNVTAQFAGIGCVHKFLWRRSPR
jgi:hypothetical protein